MSDDEDPSPEFVEWAAKAIAAEKAGEHAVLHVGPWAGFELIGMLQLVTRHQGLTPAMRQHARDLIARLSPMYDGTPAEEVIRRGSHPEWDVDP